MLRPKLNRLHWSPFQVFLKYFSLLGFSFFFRQVSICWEIGATNTSPHFQKCEKVVLWRKALASCLLVATHLFGVGEYRNRPPTNFCPARLSRGNSDHFTMGKRTQYALINQWQGLWPSHLPWGSKSQVVSMSDAAMTFMLPWWSCSHFPFYPPPPPAVSLSGKKGQRVRKRGRKERRGKL